MTERIEPPFYSGPYLQAACLCEQVLEERDGVKSAIRIVDRVTRSVTGPDPPAAMEPFDYQMKMLLKFKSGRARGSIPVTIRLEKPSGESFPPDERTVYFEGEDDRGVDLIVNMAVRFETEGLYWFDIELEGVRVTRIPLRLIYTRTVTQRQSQHGDQSPPQAQV